MDLADPIAIVDFEAAHQQDSPGRKAEAIRAAGWRNDYAYAAALNQAIEDPRALAHRPVLVNRLRTLRERRFRIHG